MAEGRGQDAHLGLRPALQSNRAGSWEVSCPAPLLRTGLGTSAGPQRPVHVQQLPRVMTLRGPRPGGFCRTVRVGSFERKNKLCLQARIRHSPVPSGETEKHTQALFSCRLSLHPLGSGVPNPASFDVRCCVSAPTCPCRGRVRGGRGMSMLAWGSSCPRCLRKTLSGLQDCWHAWDHAGFLVGTRPGP